MKNIFFITWFLIGANCFAQTITPQVINSAGGNWQLPGGVTVSDNIGEPFVTTVSNGGSTITQGFLQNFIINNKFTVSMQKNDVSCLDQKDGNISLAITSSVPSYTAQYFWQPQSICPSNNCANVDSLKPGTYTVSVKINYTVNSLVKTDTSNVFVIDIFDSNGPCKVKIYNGITINGDGINDVFTIDNISDFPNNHLLIYNRWGLLMYDEHGYDNTTKFWPKKDDVGKLASTTYFYVLYLDNGSKPLKGWIELLHD